MELHRDDARSNCARAGYRSQTEPASVGVPRCATAGLLGAPHARVRLVAGGPHSGGALQSDFVEGPHRRRTVSNSAQRQGPEPAPGRGSESTHATISLSAIKAGLFLITMCSHLFARACA